MKIPVFLLVAMLVVSACSKPTPEPTAAPVVDEAPVEESEAPGTPDESWEDIDPSGQEVIYWHQHSRSREEALNEIVEEFNNTNEWGITVSAEYQGGYNDIFNKMLGVINTPDAPNLVVAYQNQSGIYHLAEGMQDMNGIVNSSKWGLTEEEKADYFSGFYNQDVFSIYDGARLGFPPNRSMEMLYYNIDWLKELGYEKPPQTPQEFKEMACAAAVQPFSRATGEGNIGYELDINASTFASLAFGRGGEIFDYNANKFTYNNEESVQAMRFLQDLFESGCVTIVAERFGDQTDFGAGKTLFTFDSSAGFPFYRSAVDEGAQFEWSVAPIPYTTTEPAPNVYGASLSITNTTPEQELAAWLFIKYFTRPEVQARWVKASNFFPVRSSVAEGLSEYFSNNPAYQTAFDLLPYGKFEPQLPGYDFIRLLVEEAMAAIADGADIQNTLDQLNEQANAILSEHLIAPLPTPVPPDTPEPPEAELGKEGNPIKVLFVPSVDVNFMIESGDLVEQGLHDATGLFFDVSVPASYAATIEEMCASPDDTIAFIPAFGYVLANNLCGVEPGLASERFGRNVYWAEFIVPRDSEIQSVEDLEGKSWAYPEVTSTSGYLYPNALFADLGITTGEQFEAGDHASAVRAVYNGEADFSTVYYGPPRLPVGEGEWTVDMAPDIPDELVSACAQNEEGQLYCGGYRVMDARATLSEEAPDVVQKVRILDLTSEIPNDTMSFSPEFPDELRQSILNGVTAFVGTEACLESLCHEGFYGWTAVGPIFDESFDGVRLLIKHQGITLENIGQ